MLSTRVIRRKIRTVQNIRKITDAMRMVAAAKLRRVQAKVAAGRPYSEKMTELLHRVAPHAQGVQHPLLEVREPVSRIGLIVMAADRGLCGSFNSNILRRAKKFIDGSAAPVELVTVGKKARDFFNYRRYAISRSFLGLSAQSSALEIGELSAEIRGMYETKRVDEVHILYTEFLNAVQQRPKQLQFLPFMPPSGGGDAGEGTDYIFEPDPKALMEALIPRYVDTTVYHLVLESTASEHGARMMAMTNAATNAAEVIDSLTLSFNKARQASITGELLEIVAGADALMAQA